MNRCVSLHSVWLFQRDSHCLELWRLAVESRPAQVWQVRFQMVMKCGRRRDRRLCCMRDGGLLDLYLWDLQSSMIEAHILV